MSRRGRGKPQVGVALFPFLAVLICTMGSLIVLLLLVVQQAKVNANTIAVAPTPLPEKPQIDEAALRQQIEDADWRRDLLEQQRAAKAQELSEQRLALAHLEDHIRRLQDQWKDLEAQAAQLHDQDASKAQTRDRVAAEMQQLAAQIEQAQQELAQARQQQATGKPKSFSIIPYDGPNGTSRRPIYIECTGEAVIIQPEGFALNARDFEGPMGPGNPLDACLRAIREYLARNPEFAKQGEPYPLLIVRPDGVLSYAAARSAMKSWDDEFGYELIEHDTKLAYPAPDPTLRMLLERAVTDARRRQDLLAAAAPSRFKGSGGGGGGGGGSAHGGFRSVVQVPDFGEDGGGTGGGAGQSGSRETGIGRGGGQAFNEGYNGSRMQKSTGNQAGSEQQRPGGKVEGDNANFAGGSQGQGAPSADGSPSGDGNVQPLAQKKGANWGLPNFTNKATGITRPIRIRIEADRLLIVPERGERRAARTVPIEGSMTRATEELVSQIWDEVDGWGIAVSNGYWKPILNVEVANGQDALFQQLQTLLDGSGLEVRRRSP